MSSDGGRRGHLEAGPLARHLAEQVGVDLEKLHGSGPGGRVTRTDVEQAAATRATAQPPRVRATLSRGGSPPSGRRPGHRGWDGQ
ncbi:E3 binding domain-containing protein [Streptomyces aureus]